MGIKIQTTSNDLILIRKVRNDDAKQYIELINSVWRDAYKNIFPEECIIREVKEETGLTLNTYKLRCIVTYVSKKWETEYMYVFTSNDYTGKLIECNEGDLQWIEKDKVTELNTWEGDKIFVDEIQNNNKFFTIKFNYDGDRLIKYDLKEY